MRPSTGLLVVCVLVAACGSRPASEARKEPPKQYQLHGEVVSVDAKGGIATINGQKIEGWMGAMSMEYPVKDPQEFSTLHPHDCIDATVFVQGTEYWVGEVKHSQGDGGDCVVKDATKNP
jgi:Cu/Ag efflux protein CusF